MRPMRMVLQHIIALEVLVHRYQLPVQSNTESFASLEKAHPQEAMRFTLQPHQLI